MLMLIYAYVLRLRNLYNIGVKVFKHTNGLMMEGWIDFTSFSTLFQSYQSRKENPQKPTQLSSRSHPRHLVGKKDSTKDTIIDITSDSQVNSNFPNRWSQASLTFNN